MKNHEKIMEFGHEIAFWMSISPARQFKKHQVFLFFFFFVVVVVVEESKPKPYILPHETRFFIFIQLLM